MRREIPTAENQTSQSLSTILYALGIILRGASAWGRWVFTIAHTPCLVTRTFPSPCRAFFCCSFLCFWRIMHLSLAFVLNFRCLDLLEIFKVFPWLRKWIRLSRSLLLNFLKLDIRNRGYRMAKISRNNNTRRKILVKQRHIVGSNPRLDSSKLTLFFLYKNKSYKNIEAQNRQRTMEI